MKVDRFFFCRESSNVDDPEPAADGRCWKSLAFAVESSAACGVCITRVKKSVWNARGSSLYAAARQQTSTRMKTDVSGCASLRCCNCSSPAAETSDATATSDNAHQSLFICAANGAQQRVMRRCGPPARTSTSGDAGVRMCRAQARRSRAERKFLRS